MTVSSLALLQCLAAHSVGSPESGKPPAPAPVTADRAHTRHRYRCPLPGCATSSPPRCGSCPASAVSVSAVYPGSQESRNECPRSSTQPSKSAGVMALGDFSSGFDASSSFTGACLVHHPLRHAGPATAAAGQGSSPLWYCTISVPPSAHKLIQPRLRSRQLRPRRSRRGSRSRSRSTPTDRPTVSFRRRQQMRRHAQLLNRLGNQVARAHHVADPQARRQLHVHLPRLQVARPV